MYRSQKILSFISLVGSVLFLGACSLMQRHPHSGYYDSQWESQSSSPNIYQERRGAEKERTMEELGFSSTRNLSDEEHQQLMDRIELNRLEKNLDSQREKKQYYTYKSNMANDRERAYFLRIPTYEGRQTWLKNRGISTNDEEYSDDVASIIEKGDVALGMSKKAVMESWGDPDAVEVAGNPVYGNERWQYAKMVSTASGYSKEMRVIYFEAGRVVGWEKQED